ncbi:heme exporter protein CcmD [Rhizobium sp. KVB221]|uniref:Heme exporter protein D n=1 Tax=Rhizobium setariae TaxID=2801340 RepID=A0A937CQP4_9HYPH|nr:heme exporter protein CcmD [Rhizobium setariae]MBL0374769.1 heme exporter protein CcmD [Rhizobium setariae]
MSHAFYIYAAWGLTGLTVFGLIAHTLFENFRLQADLKRLEAMGIRRRSTETQGKQP